MRYSFFLTAAIQLAWIAAASGFSNGVTAAAPSDTSIVRSSHGRRDVQEEDEQFPFLIFEPFDSPITLAESPNLVSSSDNGDTITSTTAQIRRPFLRRRRLPGNDYNIEGLDMMSAEAGFAVGLSFFIILLLLLCCCCCGRRRGGGGGGSSCLWDLVAIVCLWEMCCDNDGVGDGFLRF